MIETITLSRAGRFAVRDLEFTAIDFETTGLNPGHVVEAAAVRVRHDGTVVGEVSTVVNPGPGIGPGPTNIHRLTRADLDRAPAFGDVAGHFLELFQGSVLVAHNLSFENRFLGKELERIGARTAPLPGVCTLSAARRALRLPNYRLSTVAGSLGLGDFSAHLALADARMSARVMSVLVSVHGLALASRPIFAELPELGTAALLSPRSEPLPRARAGWLAELVDRLPGQVDSLGGAYRDLLADALADHHISDDESRMLAAVAAHAGLGAEEVRRIHREFVGALRKVAEGDGIVTVDEERELREVASALRVPEVLSGLRREAPSRRGPARRVLVLGSTRAAAELRAAVLGSGTALARNLTTSVTHLVVDGGVSPYEPRVVRAKELGVEVLDVAAAWTGLGLAGASSPTVPMQAAPTVVVPAQEPRGEGAERVDALAPQAIAAPWRKAASQVGASTAEAQATERAADGRSEDAASPVARWAGWALAGAGLSLMFIAAVGQFGGEPLAAAIPLGILGVAALLGGRRIAGGR